MIRVTKGRKLLIPDEDRIIAARGDALTNEIDFAIPYAVFAAAFGGIEEVAAFLRIMNERAQEAVEVTLSRWESDETAALMFVFDEPESGEEVPDVAPDRELAPAHAHFRLPVTQALAARKGAYAIQVVLRKTINIDGADVLKRWQSERGIIYVAEDIPVPDENSEVERQAIEEQIQAFATKAGEWQSATVAAKTLANAAVRDAQAAQRDAEEAAENASSDAASAAGYAESASDARDAAITAKERAEAAERAAMNQATAAAQAKNAAVSAADRAEAAADRMADETYSKAETDALIGEHTDNTSNPHGVTAAQVGAYSSSETDALLDGKLAKAGGILTGDVSLTGAGKTMYFRGTNINFLPVEEGQATRRPAFRFTGELPFYGYDVGQTAGRIRLDASGGIIDVGQKNVPQETKRLATVGTVGSLIGAHAGDKTNPHEVTAAQVGAYTESQTDALIGAHTGNTSNPHGVTAAQTGAYSSSETDALLNGKLDKTGGAIIGGSLTISEGSVILVQGSRITGLPSPESNSEPVPKGEFDTALSGKLNNNGDTMWGNLNVSGKITADGGIETNGDINVYDHKVLGVATPTNPTDGANKNYVDTQIGNITTATQAIIALQQSYIGNGGGNA